MRAAEPEPQSDPTTAPSAHGDQREAEVVPADRAVAVAEGLQHGDLVALDARSGATSTMLSRKAATPRKIAGITRAEDAVLGDLVGDEAMRDLVVAPVGAEPAVALEQPVEPREHLRLGRARVRAASDTSLKAPSMSKAGPRASRLDPEHAEAPVVGEDARAAGSRRCTRARARRRRCAAAPSARCSTAPIGRRARGRSRRRTPR